MPAPLASIIINNCNYCAYLRGAIESCLEQTYANLEIIVVDDGSTDGSRALIEGYGSRLRAVYQENKGQASALNAGVKAARGDLLFFLDADDYCHRERVAKIVGLCRETDPDCHTSVLLFHPQRMCRKDGSPNGKRFPPKLVRIGSYLRGKKEDPLREGQMTVVSTPMEASRFLRRKAYLPFLTSATSGISLTRPMAEALFPLPEEGITICADSFIALGSLLNGPVVLLNEELSFFRIHGRNRYMVARKRPNADLFFNQRDQYLNAQLRKNGIEGAVLTLDNWQRVRRYLKNKPPQELARLMLRAETHQYVRMLACQFMARLAGQGILTFGKIKDFVKGSRLSRSSKESA